MADTLAPTVDSLLIDVRANTQGFAADVAAMRGTFDGTLARPMSDRDLELLESILGAISFGAIVLDADERVVLKETKKK